MPDIVISLSISCPPPLPISCPPAACSESFDYEEQQEYVFNMIVSDNGRTPRQSDDAAVTIAITNVNDEVPEFDQDTYGECYIVFWPS